MNMTIWSTQCLRQPDTTELVCESSFELSLRSAINLQDVPKPIGLLGRRWSTLADRQPLIHLHIVPAQV